VGLLAEGHWIDAVILKIWASMLPDGRLKVRKDLDGKRAAGSADGYAGGAENDGGVAVRQRRARSQTRTQDIAILFESVPADDKGRMTTDP